MQEYDENNLPQPELQDSDVDNSKPILPQLNDNPELPPAPQPSVEPSLPPPPPVEDKALVPPAANDNTQTPPATDNAQTPPPAESKRSCTAMMYSSSQTGLLALLAAFVLALLAYAFRRQSR